MARKIQKKSLSLAAKNALPKEILVSDFDAPRYYPRSNKASFAVVSDRTGEVEVRNSKNKYGNCASFEMWFVPGNGFGWVIPTLLIAKAAGRRAGRLDRTYAVTVKYGETVRVGFGPHVTDTVTVYVRNRRVKALTKFFDLASKGSARANEIRDRISTRRANGAMRRSLYGFAY